VFKWAHIDPPSGSDQNMDAFAYTHADCRSPFVPKSYLGKDLELQLHLVVGVRSCASSLTRH
jgi:hypothetical protein